MPCYSPLEAFIAGTNSSGKKRIVFSRSDRHANIPQKLPCGQCIGCRLERSRQWAMRIVHEAQMHEQNCFITLTFNPESLINREFPESLDVRDFQLFMKRLRKRFTGRKIRFFHCGEYGDLRGRPHYHAIIFGLDFPDKLLWRTNHRGDKLYTSDILSELWPFGFASIGDVTFESAAYCARYVIKKVTGDKADLHYSDVLDPTTGDLLRRKPEYTTMSRRSGIGKNWFDEFQSDVFPSDEVVLRGVKMRPPRYYDSLYEHLNPEDFRAIKDQRKLDALDPKVRANNTPERLEVRHHIARIKLDRLKRNHDID